jgi:TonB-linked SusC/RagA family outer membrane protein
MNLQQTKKFSLSFILLLLLTAGAFAQVREVTGQVTDNDGKPVKGVTVSVKGTAGNVITDANGRWKVMATPEQTIVFSHIAYATKEVKVGDHPTVDVKLAKNDSQLDDVIVIGYGTQRQKNITGAVTSVNLQKISEMPVASISDMLRGQVPGLSVQGGSQRPGELPSLSVRQQFNWGKDGGSSNPLIVIDDVIQVDPSTGLSSMERFNLLDLSEVESITVLRDAAAAIYGSRASQGAIIVKTKRGKIGAPKISYAGKFETNNAISHGKVMNAYDYGVFANRFGRAQGNWKPENFFSDAELQSMKSLNYDWLMNDWERANAMQHSLTVSGGSEKATFFAGGSYYTQGANLGSQDYNKYSFRTGSDVTVANGLKLSATIGANNSNVEKSFSKIGISDGSYGAVGGEQRDYSILLHMPKYIPWIYNVNGVDQYISPELTPKTVGAIVSNNSLSNTNYYALLNNGSKTTDKTFNYNANFSLSYAVPFIKGLSFKGTYAIQSSSENTEQAMMPVTLVQNTKGNVAGQHLYDNATWSKPTVNNKNSRVSYNNETGTTEQMNFFVNYDRSFGDHNISAVFSGERAKNTYDKRTQLYVQPTQGVYNGTSVTAGTMDPTNTVTSRMENGTLSYLGRISYNYKNKYLLQFLFRADASSRFAPENYWGKFPTLSAGWVISDENWFKDNVPWMNFLKLRASVGKTGTDNVKPWKWIQLYSILPNKGMGFGDNGGKYVNGITPEVAPNRDVKWDQNIQRNFGIDFSLLQNRLSAHLDQYFNSYTDILTSMAGTVGVPISVGGGFAEQNFSALNSWGTEISVTWKDKIANKVDYSIGMNFGIGNYKTTKYLDQPFAYPSEMATRTATGNYGNPGIWGYQTWKETSGGDGILRTDEDIDNYWAYLTDLANKSGTGAGPKYGDVATKTGLKKGMIAYQDVRGNLNANDHTYAGPNGQITEEQDYALLKKNSKTYGINTNLSFSYKGISLLAQLVTSWGGLNRIDYIKNSTSSTASLWAQPVFMNDMYDPVDNVSGKYPNLAYYDDFGGNNSDADFWKVSSFRMYVRTLSIGYTIQRNFLRRAHIDNAKIYLAGNNLWDFYNPYPNHYRNMYDAPNVAYPTLRTWALGINLGF